MSLKINNLRIQPQVLFNDTSTHDQVMGCAKLSLDPMLTQTYALWHHQYSYLNDG